MKCARQKPDPNQPIVGGEQHRVRVPDFVTERCRLCGDNGQGGDVDRSLGAIKVALGVGKLSAELVPGGFRNGVARCDIRVSMARCRHRRG